MFQLKAELKNIQDSILAETDTRHICVTLKI